MTRAASYDLIVIGGGPAGLSAAIHAIRKRLDVLLIARSLGGKTNRRLQLPGLQPHLVLTGEDIVDRFLTEITYLDFMHITAEIERVVPAEGGFRVQVRDEGEATRAAIAYQAPMVIVATGTSPERLNIPGEREFQMRGLCYSAITYAQLFIDRTAIVVGDGPLALRSTLELALIAQRVRLVAATAAGLATPLGQRLQTMDNVDIITDVEPQEVQGDTYARRLLVLAQGKIETLEADGIFVEQGLIPQAGCVAGLVEQEPEGWIKVDSYNRTNIPGIFAAGDVTNVHTEQLLIAIGEGAKAALAAHDYWLTQS
jgi:thioredoxin reductase